MSLHDQSFSDDEVFCSKLTIKELKKRFQPLSQRQTIGCTTGLAENLDESIKIIETKSEPDILTIRDESANDLLQLCADLKADPDTQDDSFVQMETMISNLCLPSTGKDQAENLNNTLDVVDYILKHGSSPHVRNENAKHQNIPNIEVLLAKNDIQDEYDEKKITLKNELETIEKIDEPQVVVNDGEKELRTPIKNIIKVKHQEFATPNPVSECKTPLFKTPSSILSHRQPNSASKKTPLKSNNAFQHIASPVATYINNSPQVPLVKDIHPRKPLPGPSSIPKFVKSKSQVSLNNKENTNTALPSVAYRSAKETKLVNVPNKVKVPGSSWFKKITSSLPRPLVIKHDYRENRLSKKVLLHQQEDSFADLSLHQADVSVCVQKSAFSKP